MGTQPSSGDQYIYIIQILLREVRGAETLPPALQILLPPARIYPPFLLVSPPVSSIVSWFSNLIVPVTPRAGPNSPNSRHSCAACCCLSNLLGFTIPQRLEGLSFAHHLRRHLGSADKLVDRDPWLAWLGRDLHKSINCSEGYIACHSNGVTQDANSVTTSFNDLPI